MVKNKKILYWILAVLVASVFIFAALNESQLLTVKPPPAAIEINGKEQISGVGSFCWNEAWKALCVDMAGFVTAYEPLPAVSPFTVHLRLPLDAPPEELQLSIIRVMEKDELEIDARGFRLWRFQEGKSIALSLQREQDIELSLEPGLYVLNVFTRWQEKGDVSFGFLLSVTAERQVPEPPNSPSQTTPTGKEADIRGNITVIQKADLQSRERGIIGTVLIEGVLEKDTEFDRALVTITNKTRILEQEGQVSRSKTFDDLRAGQKVQALFTGTVLESYPVQATAIEIVILK